MFLQEARDGIPPALPPAPARFALERRESQWLQEVSPHRPAADDVTVFELRRYDVRTAQGDRFLKLMLGALPIRQKYSPNFGVWMSVSGRREQVLHLWGYRDLDERNAVRAQLKGDAEWGAYTATILPMLQTLSSNILTPLLSC